jgi:hypothetical protein
LHVPTIEEALQAPQRVTESGEREEGERKRIEGEERLTIMPDDSEVEGQQSTSESLLRRPGVGTDTEKNGRDRESRETQRMGDSEAEEEQSSSEAVLRRLVLRVEGLVQRVSSRVESASDPVASSVVWWEGRGREIGRKEGRESQREGEKSGREKDRDRDRDRERDGHTHLHTHTHTHLPLSLSGPLCLSLELIGKQRDRKPTSPSSPAHRRFRRVRKSSRQRLNPRQLEGEGQALALQ